MALKIWITAVLFLSNAAIISSQDIRGTDTLDCDSEIVFLEDFGSGAVNPGSALPAGTITYCYEDLTGSCPSNAGITPGSLDDGSYSIMNDPRAGIIYASGDTTAWLSMEDHTPDDSDGYMLVVNASVETGEFYRLNDIPVIGGEDYAFSAWFANILSDVSLGICGSSEVPVNVNFNVEDAATGGLLGTFSSGDIYGTGQPEWSQTEFLFTATSSFINIVLVNNGPGGCGNDFAIDDIQLMGCIANTTSAVNDTLTGCEESGIIGNVLDNDLDEQGDDQTVTSVIIDTNGDLVPDTEVSPGQTVSVAGLSDSLGAYPEMGSLTLNTNGLLTLVHEPLNLPGVIILDYVICDNGIPSVCDTASVLIQITCDPNSTLAVNDSLSGCSSNGITGNVLSNDIDSEGHQQSVTGLFVDLDGDGIAETSTTIGDPIVVGGISDELGPVAVMGELTVDSSGSLLFAHEPYNLAGIVVLEYIVCDNGIPVACDTAAVVIRIDCEPFDTLDCPSEIVFSEDFGSGAVNPGPPLPSGTITYCYEDLTGTCPSEPFLTPGSISDGSYSIMNDPMTGIMSNQGDTSLWISVDDHTVGDTSGYMLVVNADFEPGEFYRLNDIPVLNGETYEFSAWFINILPVMANGMEVCGGEQVPVNVRFSVEDAASGTELGSLSTGNLYAEPDPEWSRRQFLFTASSSSINIVLKNNGPGGCGNDFAIDDIKLTGCIANSTHAADDAFSGCSEQGITGNVLSNDTDPEGDQQTLSGLYVDLDGDGDTEVMATIGQSILVGGMSDDLGPVSAMGELTVEADGSVLFVHEPINLAGTVVFEYIICDDGIPSVCDTATGVITINCEAVDTLGCRTEVVFTEDFGSGAINPGPELPAGTITYCYEDLSGTCPSEPFLTPGSINDGSYSIMNDPHTGIIYSAGDTSAWISVDDHTVGDTSGYMLVVNADFEPGEFYRLNDIAIVNGESYAFSAWFINILSESSIGICADLQVPVNVKFVVEDASSGAVLGSFSSGDIYAASSAEWLQTEFLFTASSSFINIVLANNGPGGCGNDFAIDDIQLIGCIANTTTAVDDVLDGCLIDEISGNVLDNDMDAQGDDQAVVAVVIDTDGDLVPDQPVSTGIPTLTGGVSMLNGPVSDMGTLTVSGNGEVLFEHETSHQQGSVVFDYIICDGGIPSVCDTGRVIIIVDCDTPDCVREVIFTEDFGFGAINPGPPLSPGTITYCYENLTGSCPSNSGITPGSIDDGSYSIMNNPRTGQISVMGDTLAWLSIEDHTEEDTNGYMLVVNADFEPGEFYRRNNVSVVEGEEYLFSAWFANIQSTFSVEACEGMHVPVNVNFNVEDAAADTLLGSFSTGDLFATGEAEWMQTVFEFIATSNTINIVLVNNGPGGCGNDFVIDDIQLFGCIANNTIAVDDQFNGCEEEQISDNVLANDIDPEGNEQFVTTIFADLDGDLIPDVQYNAGQSISVGGFADASGPVPNIGILTVDEDGSMLFEHVPYDLPGTVVFEYVICDDGLPVACDTASVLIIVDCIPPCFIPDFISPNGDGLNDVFEIECAPDFPEMDVLIYNRWGNMVWFKEGGYQNDWGGTWLKNNEPLPDGTYYFVVRFNEEMIPDRAGDILLLR